MPSPTTGQQKWQMTIWSGSCLKSRTFIGSLDPDSIKSTSDLPGRTKKGPNTKLCRTDHWITPLNRSTSSRDLCAWQEQDWAHSVLPFPLPTSPHFCFKQFSALGFPGRSDSFWEGHWEQDAQKNYIFIILLLHTNPKNNLYGRQLTMPRKCCSNTSFPMSSGKSIPVRACLQVAVGSRLCRMKHLRVWPPRCPQRSQTKQFRSRQIREGNQGKRK